MDVNPTLILALLAGLVFLGMFLEEVFRRTGIPDVLILLILGIGVSIAGVFHPSWLNGLDRIFTTCALVIILFEGALRLRLEDLKAALGASTAISLLGFGFTVGGLSLLGMTLFGLPPLVAVLFGCILGGTSSAVVIPMVQTLKMNKDTKTVLTLESALTDVLSIVFTLALAKALTAGDIQASVVGKDLAYGFGAALLIGAVAGFAWAIWLRVLRKKRSSMLLVGAAVFIVYAAAEALGAFGAIACLAFGIVLGNAPAFAASKPYAHELGIFEGERMFLSEMAFLLKVFFFVYLGASLKLTGYEPFVYGGLATLVIFAVRPLAVRLALRAGTTPRKDASLAAALGPRGLAAAVLATIPGQMGIAGGGVIEAVAFGVIFFSIVIVSALTLFADKPFVSAAYGRIFRRYTGKTDDEEAALPPAPAAPVAPEVLASSGSDTDPAPTA
jgi:cell volume regulation protein A